MSLKVVEPAPPGGGSSLVISLPQVKAHPAVKTFIRLADDYLGELGYTEHGFRHAKIVARDARKLLKGLGYEKREPERAAIAGYLHDMGNFISRAGHPQSGAVISYQILGELGMPYKEIGIVLGAVGNHEEGIGQPVSPEMPPSPASCPWTSKRGRSPWSCSSTPPCARSWSTSRSSWSAWRCAAGLRSSSTASSVSSSTGPNSCEFGVPLGQR